MAESCVDKGLVDSLTTIVPNSIQNPRLPLPVRHVVEVVFSMPLERPFHYSIPPELQGSLQAGMRVSAPFGKRERMGFAVRLLNDSPVSELKAIHRVIDAVSMVTGERWALASWLADYYYCSFGEALAAMVPSDIRFKGTPVVPAQQETVATHDTERANGARFDAEGVGVRRVQEAGTSEPLSAQETVRLTLTPHQSQGLQTILSALDGPEAGTILVYGVTGSGKTELYLRAIEAVLKQDRSAIYLIPEIALTPQTIDRFRERFGERIAVWHSRLTKRMRTMEWARVMRGEAPIVIGARSAIFAPVRRLGLIILDEEHEQTYKQQSVPYFHAREVAQARAKFVGATVLLGSATPSVEAYYAAIERSGQIVRLPERVEGRALPAVEIVDMRGEFQKGRRSGPLSDRLQQALQGTVERGEQAMLLLNRRGFARFAQCQHCGTVVRCRHCSVPLIYHAKQQALICHYCNFQQPPVELCGECKKGYFRFRGAGTERIESELHRHFPVASIARMDRDTTKSRESHREIYNAVRAQQIGLLVGTQMIAKGFDFPQVTLVGVVSADTALNLPDFRAGERTFDLLTQVAGRAGRGEQPGRVLIQTYCPTHYAIQAAKYHDYEQFYRMEIEIRRRLKLPPFAHLVELTLRGSSRERVYEAARELATTLRQATVRRRLSAVARRQTGASEQKNSSTEKKRSVGQASITLLGPAPHRVPRLREVYRVCLILKASRVEPIIELLRHTLQAGRRFHGMPLTIDVDPV